MAPQEQPAGPKRLGAASSPLPHQSNVLGGNPSRGKRLYKLKNLLPEKSARSRQSRRANSVNDEIKVGVVEFGERKTCQLQCTDPNMGRT
jgi:hypothetical protein